MSTVCMLLLLASVLAVSADIPLHLVPIKYVTTTSYQLGSYEMATFQADIGCDSNKEAQIRVCAELPNNWNWDPFKGFVYLNVFNDTLDTNNLTQAIASTGKPHTGSGATPAACTTIQKWRGGALLVRVDGNNYSPTIYTISATVTGNSTKQRNQAGNLRSHILPPQTLSRAQVRNGAAPTKLVPIASVSTPISLEYGNDVTLVLDLCLNHSQSSDYKLTTSVIAQEGTITQYVCDGTPCIPDTQHVITSDPSPTPISACVIGLNSKPKKVFVTVHAAGGTYNSTTRKIISSFMFGASLSSLP